MQIRIFLNIKKISICLIVFNSCDIIEDETAGQAVEVGGQRRCQDQEQGRGQEAHQDGQAAIARSAGSGDRCDQGCKQGEGGGSVNRGWR